MNMATVSPAPSAASAAAWLNPQEELQVALVAVEDAEEKLKTLTADHAPTFVAVERRSQACAEQLTSLLQHVEKACTTISTSQELLNDLTTQPLNDSNTVNSKMTLDTFLEKQTSRRKTLLHHSHLLEILELPSFMDACIKSHLYDEAVSIAVFANTLERRHGTTNSTKKNPILASVIQDIRKRSQHLYTHLLLRLQGDLTLPQCLEIITCLRRLNSVEVEQEVHSYPNKNKSNNKQQKTTGIMEVGETYEKISHLYEMKLQVDFLEARNVWLDSGLSVAHQKSLRFLEEEEVDEEEEEKEKEDKFMNKNHVHGKRFSFSAAPSNNNLTILDTIEVFRTRCFEIVTEFNAIFRSSIPTSSSLESSSSSSNTILFRSSEQGLLLLSSWITRRIQTFLSHTLESHLTSIVDPSSLRDVLDSVVFFALSMKRVGADFSSLLPPIFESHLVRILSTQWNEGLHQLEETLKVCRDAGKASPLQDLTVDTTTSGSDYDHPMDPPKKILSYPPLARFVNVYLSSLNDLRRFLLVGCIVPLRTFLHSEYLVKVDHVLKQNERIVMTPGFLQGKGDAAKNLRSCASGILEMFDSCIRGYLVDALEMAFGVVTKHVTSNSIQMDPVQEEQDPQEEEKDGDKVLVKEEMALGEFNLADLDPLTDENFVSESLE